MTTYFKATRPDGTDFHTGTIQYDTDEVIRHPDPNLKAKASRYLSVATVPTDCMGFRWPCRLFEVEAMGEVRRDPDYPNKRRVTALRRIRELPAHEALGPQGEHLVNLFESIRTMTADQIDAARNATCDSARYDAGNAARCAARYAVWYAAWSAWDAAWYAAGSAWDAWNAAWDAARALLVRDLISVEHYDVLTRPLRLAGVVVHPDDPEVK